MFQYLSFVKDLNQDMKLLLSKQNPLLAKKAPSAYVGKQNYLVLLMTSYSIVFILCNFLSSWALSAPDYSIYLYNGFFVVFFWLALMMTKKFYPNHISHLYLYVTISYVPFGLLFVNAPPYFWLISLLASNNLIIMQLKTPMISALYGIMALLVFPTFLQIIFCSSEAHAIVDFCSIHSKTFNITVYAFIMHTLTTLSTKLFEERLKKECKENKIRWQIAEKKLSEVNNKLQEIFSRHENFILSFSHEIRNPLNVVTTNIDLSLDEPDINKVRERLRTMKVCGEIILQFLNNILDSSKMEHGDLEVSPKTVNFKRFISNYWVILKELTFQKKLEANIFLSKSLPAYLKLDPHRTMQILLNLSSNAVKFTERGEITVIIDWVKKNDSLKEEDFQASQEFKGRYFTAPNLANETNPRKISMSQVTVDEEFDGMVESKESNIRKLQNLIDSKASNYYSFRAIERNRVLNEKESFTLLATKYEESVIDLENPRNYYLKIEVLDTGVGMSPEALSRLFQKFSQVDASAEKKKVGSGLGLWITKQICEKMGGGIKVHSKVGKGSDFVAILDAAPSDNAYVDSLPMSPVARKKSSNFIVGPITLRVLLICDDPNIPNELKEKLTYAVNIVDVAKDSNKAMELYKKHKGKRYDLVFIHNKLPELDAKKTCENVRKFEREKGLKDKPVILFYEGMLEGEIEHCITERGSIRASNVINVPIVETEIKDAVKQITKKVLSEMRGKVLVVDDDGFNLRLVCQILEKHNVSYLEATNGEQAVNMFKQDCEDIIFILMDCEMPLKNGYEAAREIKEIIKERNLQDVPIIGLSAHTGEEHKKKALEYGMTNVFTKPLNLGDFVRVIKYFAEF